MNKHFIVWPTDNQLQHISIVVNQCTGCRYRKTHLLDECIVIGVSEDSSYVEIPRELERSKERTKTLQLKSCPTDS